MPEAENKNDYKSASLAGSYWDRTNRVEAAGMVPTCPSCGEKMFAADDHGRFTCFCDLGRVMRV